MGIFIGLVVAVVGALFLRGFINGIRLAKLAEGNPDAHHDLGVRFLQRQRFEPAIDQFKRAAELGQMDSAYNLGIIYERGVGVPKNDKTALAWFSKAAEGGMAKAQYNLAVLYFNGRGYPKSQSSFRLAYEWFLKASTQGVAAARESVALFERSNEARWDGDGLVDEIEIIRMRRAVADYSYTQALNAERDSAPYASFLQQAADYGHSEAQATLGHLYLNGRAAAQDLSAAYAYMAKAAEGYTPSSRAVSVMELVTPTWQPNDDAMEWSAVEALSTLDMRNWIDRLVVARRYLAGLGVPQDYRKAAYWLWLCEQPENAAWCSAVNSVPKEQWPAELKSSQIAAARTLETGPSLPVT